MIDRQAHIAKLRCSVTGNGCKEDCPYRLEEEADDPRFPPDCIKDGKPIWVSCDVDRMAIHAVELLEKQATE